MSARSTQEITNEEPETKCHEQTHQIPTHVEPSGQPEPDPTLQRCGNILQRNGENLEESRAFGRRSWSMNIWAT